MVFQVSSKGWSRTKRPQLVGPPLILIKAIKVLAHCIAGRLPQLSLGLGRSGGCTSCFGRRSFNVTAAHLEVDDKCP